MSPPRISVGIPLYRSHPFLHSLRDNLADLAAEPDVEIIVSDRHGLDDTLDILKAEWRHDARFRFLKADDRLHWVDHMNLLLRESRGDYFRWMPHDDRFPGDCLKPLRNRLDTDPAVILAYGPTRAMDMAGRQIPEGHRLHSHPVAPGNAWTFRHSLDLFWRGSCDGAFKGLFRRRIVMDAGLFIRPTHELIYTERAWLFGISLLGGLGEEPASEYWKRYHPDSLHAQWRIRGRHLASITATMCGYLRDSKAGPRDTWLGMFYLWKQAAGRIAKSI